ncbi:hypothetical protein [Demequina rhizosphaerae]|nr:hypothetical protein [Demequina rhizosphaerae]
MRKRRRAHTHTMQRHWLLREHGGAPGWAIIATSVAIVGVLTYAVM